MKSKKKSIIIIIALVILIAVSILIYRSIILGESYRQELEHTYARSLGDLTEYLNDMENALSKSKYVSTSTGQASVSAKLREAGGGAKAAMSYLPFSEDKSEKIEKSISVVSDFGLYIGRKSAEGATLSDDDYKSFEILSDHVSKILDSFTEIREEASSGKISVGETRRILSGAINLPSAPGFDDGLSDLSKELSSLPTMLYDGPFSDHIEKREAEVLKDKPEITEEEALNEAAKFLDTDKSELKVKFKTDGALAAYEIVGKDETVKITKKGGQVSYFKKDLEVSESKLSYEEALHKAKEFLAETGFENMKESYYAINDNTCTINFAATVDDVIFYPDLVKVTIELNEGGMVEFTSTGYLMNHRLRKNLVPKIDEVDAGERLSKKLTIENIAIAIVATTGGEERLCYEFTCKSDDDTEVIVYINGKTGLEEQIFLITQSAEGKLVQ